jgi:hypothetical protein
LLFSGAGEVPISTKIILSSHNFKETPPAAELHARAAAMREAGADIVKIATMANDISDAATLLSLLQQKTGAVFGKLHRLLPHVKDSTGAACPCPPVILCRWWPIDSVPWFQLLLAGPTIALAMGERGQITRLLAAKYGGHLTFAALSDARASAPGQPTIAQLQQLYGFAKQGPGTKLFGIMGKPIHHSKSPLIHNTAFRHLGGFRGAVLGFWLGGFVCAAACCRPVCTTVCLHPARLALLLHATLHPCVAATAGHGGVFVPLLFDDLPASVVLASCQLHTSTPLVCCCRLGRRVCAAAG